MKLLLTSGGISNRSIVAAFNELVGKSPSEIKVGYIPTAATVEAGNKDWIINDFINFWRYGYKWIDIIDPSAASVDWKNRLSNVDVIMLSGGNTFHLLDQARKTGFGEWLKENLKNKVYVGGSASSILMGPTIGTAGGLGARGDENLPGLTDLTGLGVVDFEIAPHLPVRISFDQVKDYATKNNKKIYALDDQSAVKVVDSKEEVISEGQWEVFNTKDLH
jgi:dipeptidase E